MQNIIKVLPTEKYYSVTWMLGKLCNYDCMYCPAEWHDKDSRPHDLETMKQVWINIYSKTQHLKLPYKISFTGGEVTANKNFLPLVQWLRKEYPTIRIEITTNGSASVRYYKDLAILVNSITFSTHSEFMHEKEFFDKVLLVKYTMLKLKSDVHVNIMNEFWNQERIELYKQFLTKYNIDYSIENIDYSTQIRTNFVNKGTQDLVIS
jgi:MoaA/NifB/PqqE/SkfB family radical SAM enzyme